MRRHRGRLEATLVLSVARACARVSPILSLEISRRLFEKFSRRGVAVVARLRHRFPVLPSVAACWRDAVLNREPAVQQFVDRQARECTVFLDCGANLGFFSFRAAARNPELRVLALEPLPECHRYLQAVRRLNGLKRVEIVPGVLTGRSGRVAFSQPSERYGESGSVSAADESASNSVRAFTLNELLGAVPDDAKTLVKIDIEGHEPSALQAPVSPSNALKVRAMAIEVHLFAYSDPARVLESWFQAVQSWFKGRWWMTTARERTPPAVRYARRLIGREPIRPLDLAEVSRMARQRLLHESYFFGERT